MHLRDAPSSLLIVIFAKYSRYNMYSMSAIWKHDKFTKMSNTTVWWRYSFQLLTLFQFFVRFAVDTEATFTSTERVRSYNAVSDSSSLPTNQSRIIIIIIIIIIYYWIECTEHKLNIVNIMVQRSAPSNNIARCSGMSRFKRRILQIRVQWNEECAAQAFNEVDVDR